MTIEGKTWDNANKKWVDNTTWRAVKIPSKQKSNKISGVYAIEVEGMNMIYVGQSINIHSRWSQHKHILKKGKCEIKEMQKAWDDNKDKFIFRILEHTSENLIDKEKDFAQYFVNQGYILFNSYFLIKPKSIIISEEHIPIVTKLLRLATKGRLDLIKFDEYLDTL